MPISRSVAQPARPIAAVHRVEARGHADAEQAHPGHDERGVGEQVGDRRGGDHEQRSTASPPRGTPCPPPPAAMITSAGSAADRREEPEEHRRDAVGQRPAPRARRPGGRPGHAGLADPLRGRARPALTGGDGAEHGRARGDLAALADPRAGQQRAARADRGVRSDPDLADAHDVAVDPVAAEVHLGLDGRAAPELEQARDRGRGVQVDVLADLRAERAGVAVRPRGAGHVGGADAGRRAARRTTAAGARRRRAGSCRAARRAAAAGRRPRRCRSAPAG